MFTSLTVGNLKRASARVLAMAGFLTIAWGGAGMAQNPSPPDARGAAIIFENVRIFDGTSDRLSSPSHVLVIGNVIKTI